MSTSVSSFVTKGTEIEVLFVDPDNTEQLRWYRGIVKKAKHREDDDGQYAECDIFYEDGERVYDHRLYDSEFGDECWKFAHPLSDLIKNLRDEIKTMQDNSSDDDASNSSEYDSSDDDDVDNAEEDYKVPIRQNLLSRTLVNVSMLYIMSLAVTKLYKVSCENGFLPVTFCEAVV